MIQPKAQAMPDPNSAPQTRPPVAGPLPFARLSPIEHGLAPHYPALRRIRKRRDLLKSPLYREIGAEIERVQNAIERGDRDDPAADFARPAASQRAIETLTQVPGRLRVVAWNIQRGAHLDALLAALRGEPALRRADVLLLCEVDCGMGRSGNRNVARELATALGMSYAFGVSYLVLEDDFGENPDGAENTLALAGTAILSRLPIGRVENVDLPELKDKFSSSEKRLGKKRALLCEVLLPDGPLLCGAVHLDSNASPRQRALQLNMLLLRARAQGVPRIVVGGDLNSTTYDASATLPLLRDLLHKFFITGFRGTVEGYMTPERRYERPMFQTFADHGFSLEGFNDRARGSYRYDLHSPYAIEKVRQKVGLALTRLLQWKLRPWNGVVPARLDWFAGRGVQPLSCDVIEVRDADGRGPSDHDAVGVDLAIGG